MLGTVASDRDETIEALDAMQAALVALWETIKTTQAHQADLVERVDAIQKDVERIRADVDAHQFSIWKRPH